MTYVSAFYELGIECMYFATDCDLEASELGKLPCAVKVVNASRHGEYDFGSWKLCLMAFEHENGVLGLNAISELILCNDSCYGPLRPLREMFSSMAHRDADYWGVTQVMKPFTYLPSYFLVIRPQVLTDGFFRSFLLDVGKFTDKKEYCRLYEFGLNKELSQRGFRSDFYMRNYASLCHSSPQALSSQVFLDGMPFIRVMTAKTNPGGIARLGAAIVSACKHSGYPLGHITTHLNRVAPDYPKYWSYLTGDIEKRILYVIRVRCKPKPDKDKLRLKIWFLGCPIFYCYLPMRYGDESARIIQWIEESPKAYQTRYNFWLMFRFLRSPITVLRRLLQK